MTSYGRFLAMIATSTVVMFGLMYMNTYAFEHVRWSETRAYMALVMAGAMALVMLTYMLGHERHVLSRLVSQVERRWDDRPGWWTDACGPSR